MHLAFLTPEYPHSRTTSSAGIGTSIKNMVGALAKKGVQISVFVYGQKEDVVFSENGIKFHILKQRKYMFLGWYLHRKFLQGYLNTAIKKEHIDALEAPDWTGITAFMNLQCPVVIRMHGSDAYFCNLENRQQKKKNFWFEKTALKKADHLLSVSEFTTKQTTSLFGLQKEIKVIPNSVDMDCFYPHQSAMIPNTLLYFGSIIRKKGVLELAEIFNCLIEKKPGAELVFAGKDVVDQQTRIPTQQLIIDKLSPKALKRIKWLGALPYEKVLEQIARANVVVLPSFAEALPMTWIEAMAMEKALVTSNIGWAKEVMTDGKTGFMVAPKAHEANAQKILQLLNDPILAKKMGTAAREQMLKKFSTDVVVEKNIEFYAMVVADS